nr:acyl carrier protein [Candidatus Liberibacter asiaticus]
VELVMIFEEKLSLEIPEESANKILTVKDAVDFIRKAKQTN